MHAIETKLTLIKHSYIQIKKFIVPLAQKTIIAYPISSRIRCKLVYHVFGGGPNNNLSVLKNCQYGRIFFVEFDRKSSTANHKSVLNILRTT